jgi:hypothetical protein
MTALGMYNRREFLGLVCGTLPVLAATRAFAAPRELKTDICIYAATASGIMAAVAASREGCRVLVVEPGRWLGGMTGGGISNIDWGRREAVGGSALAILDKDYDNAQYRRVWAELVAEHAIEVLYEHRLNSVRRDGRSIAAVSFDYAPPDATGCPIASATTQHAVSVQAAVFLDCSYEGDLMAASGVSYTFGRESSQQYHESLGGVRPNLWTYDIDPYNTTGVPSSGLLPLLQDREIGPPGSADTLTMGYAFRFKYDLSGAGLPITPTEAYDPAQFEVFRRGFKQGLDLQRSRKMKILGEIIENDGKLYEDRLGNTNRSLLNTTVFGCNDAYPEGDWAVRAGIWKFHQDFFRNMTHFLRTDPSVPAKLKQQAEQATFLRGQFDDTAGLPHQLYVREARRMVSSYVVTQKDLEGKTDPPNAVGLASYGVDDWPYATIAAGGKVALSGGEFSQLYLDDQYRGIYKIPYEAITPRQEECDNLLVPVCCSASHIAMTSIRMEPVWMILGESAGVAAAMRAKKGMAVQEVPYSELRPRLLALGQKLERSADAAVG